MSPVVLDGDELGGVELRREWRNIDVLIVCEHPRLVVVIENKMHRREHEEKLQRYEDVAAGEYPGVPRLHVFLSPDAEEASDPDWIVYEYAQLHAVLSRCKRLAKSALGGDVGAFIDHYLNLIGSEFMSDAAIEQLCRRIYANHRRAIDLVIEHCATGASPLASVAEEVIRADPARWCVLNCTGRRVDFVPAGWEKWIPPICALPKQDPRFWIRIYTDTRPGRSDLLFVVGPATDNERRLRAVHALRTWADSLGTGGGKKLKTTDRWTRVWRQTVAVWDEDAPPSEEEFRESLAKALTELAKVLQTCAAILRPALMG